jgi:hypothetical protein
VAEQFFPAGADGRTAALGMKIDQSRPLWAIDAQDGVAGYDLRSRRLLARFDVTGEEAHDASPLKAVTTGTPSKIKCHNLADERATDQRQWPTQAGTPPAFRKPSR